MRRPWFHVGCSVLASCWLLGFAAPAHAIGEVFRILSSGTEYCGNFDSAKFNPTSAIPLWVRIDSATQFTLSGTQDFQPGTTLAMTGYYYATKPTSAAFVAGIAFEDVDGLAFITLRGTAKLDKNTGVVTKLSGVFIHNDVVAEDCFSSGKFVTAK